MKPYFARLCGAIAIGVALAACSGGNSGVTPSGGSPNFGPQAIVHSGHLTSVTTTNADRALARQFVPLKPHFTYTRMNNPFKNNARPSTVGYPADMWCQTQACPVMSSNVSINLYVNCPDESCWGNPEEFLSGLTGSAFMGLATQYTGGPSSAYTFGGSMSVTHQLHYSNTFYNEDIFSVLAAGVTKFQALGLGVQYHIFLPSGTDTCFDQTKICYSPDNLRSFYFCAYHDAVQYGSQYIVYSVEPYQKATVTIRGNKYYACQNQIVPPHTNRLNSGTASTLSHELFESVSDPLPNSGWFNPYYGEIGDVCAYRFMTNVKLGGRKFYIQQEYSNAVHGCDG